MYSSFQAALLRLARTLAVPGLDLASRRRCGFRRLLGLWVIYFPAPDAVRFISAVRGSSVATLVLFSVSILSPYLFGACFEAIHLRVSIASLAA